MCVHLTVCVRVWYWSMGTEVMSKYRHVSASVVVFAYINIGEAVKVSVQMNLTADIKDQQWEGGKAIGQAFRWPALRVQYSMENNDQLDPIHCIQGQKGINTGFPKSPEKMWFQDTFLCSEGNKGRISVSKNEMKLHPCRRMCNDDTKASGTRR